jgi:hypothetical protein
MMKKKRLVWCDKPFNYFKEEKLKQAPFTPTSCCVPPPILIL